MSNELIDKAVIWLLCMLTVFICGIDINYIVACMSSIIIVLIVYLDKIPKYSHEIAVAIYLLVTFICPTYVCFLPLVMYDVMLNNKKNYQVAAAIVYFVAICYEAGKGKGQTEYDMSPMFIVLIFVTVIFLATMIFAYKTSSFNKAMDKMKKVRDEGVETTYILENKNTELIRRQDYEINVATLKERNRIAREIHDNVGHMLTRAILQAGALKVIVKDEAVAEQIAGLGETLNTAMNNIRTSVHDLHDEAVDLNSAVEEMISRFPKLNTEYTYSIGNDVSNEIKYCFIAIVKEALNNIIKHSNSDKVRIKINEHPGFYQLVVHDNGTKISEDYTGGMGLASMKERVRALNGNINISTDKGFRISVSIMK